MLISRSEISITRRKQHTSVLRVNLQRRANDRVWWVVTVPTTGVFQEGEVRFGAAFQIKIEGHGAHLGRMGRLRWQVLVESSNSKGVAPLTRERSERTWRTPRLCFVCRC